LWQRQVCDVDRGYVICSGVGFDPGGEKFACCPIPVVGSYVGGSPPESRCPAAEMILEE
jgi:hypothetical protein